MISEKSELKLARMILTLSALFIFAVACGSDQAKETADSGAETDDQTTSEQIEETATEAKTETSGETETEIKEPAAPQEPETVEIEIPAGMSIVVALVDEIKTGENQTGDIFRATLDEDIVIGGKTVFAAGSRVEGLIENAVGSGRLKTDAELKITLKYLEGQEIFTNSIEDKGSSHKKRNQELIGGGAVVGGILGALKGKDVKGAIIGAAAGAAIGVGAATLTGKDNLRYEPGTKLSFSLSEPLIVEMSGE